MHIDNKSKICIKDKCVFDGPVYLKSVNGGSIVIGSSCYFNHNCSITSMSSIKIGSNCRISNNVVIVDHNHGYDSKGVNENYSIGNVIIGNNVWIGANCVILKNVSIGDCAIIGAGCVINKNVEPNTVVFESRPKKLLIK